MKTSPFLNYGAMTQKELPMHRNPGMEVVFVSEGRLRWQVDGRREEVPAGSIFFTLPWQAHGSEYLHEPGNRIHFIQFRLDRSYRTPVRTFGFHPALGVSPSEARRLSRVLSGATRHSWPASTTLAWLLQTLVSRLETDAPHLLLRGLFISLMSELADTVLANPPQTASPYLTPTERRVEQLAARMSAECAEDWPLQRMTEETGLGATQLTAHFKRLTGDSPVAYLKRLRVMKAEALLTGTGRSITEIAMACGFASSQGFCRTFRAFTNRSATQYRREAARRPGQPVQDWSAREERRRRAALMRQEWV